MPLDLAAVILEQTEGVTIDDIRKAHLLAELPQQVRSSISNRQDQLDFMGLAKAANEYFDRDGGLKATNSINSINAVDTTAPTSEEASYPSATSNFGDGSSSFTAPFEEHNAVNAVNRRTPSGSNNSNSRGNGSYSGSRNNGNTNNRARAHSQHGRGSANRSTSRPNRSSSRPRNENPAYCWYHNHYGDKATNCQQPCAYTSNNNSRSGNGRGGRR